jgi:diguanylate cyclase (GGDEF)-like protein
MDTGNHTSEALRRAHTAARERPGRALSAVLAAVATVAKSGTADEFRDAEQLLDTELIVSGRYTLAIAPLLEALEVAEARDERWIIGCLERRLAWVYDFGGDDVAALEMIERAKHSFAMLGDHAGFARCLNNLGVIWTRRRDLVGATNVLTEALALVDTQRNPLEQARVRVNFGHVCQLAGDLKRGRQLLEEAITLAHSVRHRAAGAALLNLARIDLAEANARQATDTLARAQPIIDAGDHFGQIEVWLLRGQIATLEGRYSDAYGCYSEAFRMAEAAGALREQKELLSAMSDTHAAAGDFRSALEALVRANALDEELRREQAVLQATTAAARLAAERARREAALATSAAATLRDTAARLRESRRELRDATIENERLATELERVEREDALTGLLNRRTFNEVLNAELGRAERFQRPLVVALVEIDNFMAKTASLGERIRCELLAALGKALRQDSANFEYVARFGDYEFALLLPESSLESAIEACAQLRARIVDLERGAVIAPPNADLTISVGLSSKRPGDNADAFVVRAEAELRRAKQLGGDRVEWRA